MACAWWQNNIFRNWKNTVSYSTNNSQPQIIRNPLTLTRFIWIPKTTSFNVVGLTFQVDHLRLNKECFHWPLRLPSQGISRIFLLHMVEIIILETIFDSVLNINPSLFAKHWSLGQRRAVTNVFLFHRYFPCICLDERSYIIPLLPTPHRQQL